MVFLSYLEMTDQVPPKAVVEKANGASFFPRTLTVQMIDCRSLTCVGSHHPVTVSDTGDNTVLIKAYTFPLQANHTSV